MMGAIAGLLTSSFPDSIDAFRAAFRRWTGVDAVCAALAAVGLGLCINRLDASARCALSRPGDSLHRRSGFHRDGGAGGRGSGRLGVRIRPAGRGSGDHRPDRTPFAALDAGAAGAGSACLRSVPQQVRTPGELALAIRHGGAYRRRRLRLLLVLRPPQLCGLCPGLLVACPCAPRWRSCSATTWPARTRRVGLWLPCWPSS